MPVVRNGDYNAVDIRPREHVVEIAIRFLGLGLLLPVFHARLIDIAEGGVFEVVLSVLAFVKAAVEQAVELHPAADEGNVDSVVRAKDARSRLEGELGLILRRGSGGRTQSGNGCIPAEKLTAGGRIFVHWMH